MNDFNTKIVQGCCMLCEDMVLEREMREKQRGERLIDPVTPRNGHGCYQNTSKKVFYIESSWSYSKSNHKEPN